MNLNLSTITTPLRSLWDELVERRLWPVAVALGVALIAVPVMLSKPAEPAPAPPLPPAASSDSPAVAFQPAVSTEGRKSSEIRKDLRRFSRKNPFTPQGLGGGGGGSSTAGTAQPNSSATLGGGGTATPSGSDSGSASPTASPTTTPTPTTPQIVYFRFTVDVKFGKVGKAKSRTLSQFRALPSSKDPVVIFMGVRPDDGSAVFLVSANATTTGGGECKPSKDECTFLYLKEGEKRTLETVSAAGDVVDYDLRVTKVNVERADNPTAGSSSSRSTDGSGSNELRGRGKRVVRSFQQLGL